MSSRLTVQIYVILSEYEKTGKGTLLGAKKVIRHILAKETAFRWQGNGVSSPTIPRIVPEPKKHIGVAIHVLEFAVNLKLMFFS